MRKSSLPIAIVAVIVFAGIAYLVTVNGHKAKTTTTTTSKTSTSTQQINNGVILVKSSNALGQYLTDVNGNALYTYGSDTSGVSNCSGSCISNWPPYAPTTSVATLPTNTAIITRGDGTKQYTYKNKPLYTFTSDTQGQVTGNGVSGFSVAKP